MQRKANAIILLMLLLLLPLPLGGKAEEEVEPSPPFIIEGPAVQVWPSVLGYGSQVVLTGVNYEPGETVALELACGPAGVEPWTIPQPSVEADASGRARAVVNDLYTTELIHLRSTCTATMTGLSSGLVAQGKYTMRESPGTISKVVRTAEDAYQVELGHTLAFNEEVLIWLEEGAVETIGNCTARADKDGRVYGEIVRLVGYWQLRIPRCKVEGIFDMTDGMWAVRYQSKSGKAGVAYFEIY